MRKAVLKVLKHVVHFSNANIIKNADGLMTKKPINQDVEWVWDGKRISEKKKKLKCTIDFFGCCSL